MQDLASFSCKILRISPGKTENSSISKKLLNKPITSLKADEKSKIKSVTHSEKDKNSPSKDESSLATAPENHKNCNENGDYFTTLLFPFLFKLIV